MEKKSERKVAKYSVEEKINKEFVFQQGK